MISWLLHKLKGDKIIWITVILIGLISMLAIYSSTSALAWRLKGGDTEAFMIRHGIILLAGLVVMYLVHRINYRVYARIVNGMLIVTVILLIYTIINGSELNEAARWITVMGTSFQPSDLAKLTLMILLAKILTKKQDTIKDFNEGFMPAMVWVVIICGLIAPSDLSTAMLMFTASVMVMFIAGVNLKYIGLLGLAAVLGVFLLFKTAERSGTWNSRLHDWTERITNPEYDGNDQIVQAHIAFANGGVFGMGPGKSPTRNTLPTAYADFIFAIIVEEYGLLGGGIVVLLYLVLLFRAVGIVTVSKTFGALLAAGLSFLLVMQALINMGVATGLLPITGFTLPLISMGGTSILFTAITIGIILSVSRDALKPRATSKKLQFT
jgi:cell division protein FtsW